MKQPKTAKACDVRIKMLKKQLKGMDSLKKKLKTKPVKKKARKKPSKKRKKR